MSIQVTRRLKPEEEELSRKREELAAIRAALAERELELADLRSNIAAFEGRYLRQVGTLYAELDEWKARIRTLEAECNPSAAAEHEAEQARGQARETYEAAHGEASKAKDFTPSDELKKLFREAAKRIHPDFAIDADDLERRTRFMAEVNRAYQEGDEETLRRILDDFHDNADQIPGEGIGAELIRIIRQISQAKERMSAIELEIANLHRSEIAQLKQDTEKAQQQGRDLLAELATDVREQIRSAEEEHAALTAEAAS
jgi:predicted  nucleic acid-binding Zn-ribbon protein